MYGLEPDNISNFFLDEHTVCMFVPVYMYCITLFSSLNM